MLKRLLLVALVALLGFSTVSAQFNKAETNFLQTPFKVQMNGDVVVSMIDGTSNTDGLSIAALMSKLRSTNNDKSVQDWIGTVTFTNTTCATIYDLCSNATPQFIWQDPLTPANIHAVFVTAPLGDGTSFPTRRSKYYLSQDFGATWNYIVDIPNAVRSGFPSIDGFDDGSALIGNHSADGGGANRGQYYKDASAGLGAFTRLDAPNNFSYIWVRQIATLNQTLGNKFVCVGSIQGTTAGQDSASYNTCTGVSSTPGTWLGWTKLPYGTATGESYSLARGTDGRIGLLYGTSSRVLPLANDYASVYFIESTNAGTSFSAPLKIFQPTWGAGGDSLGFFGGLSLVYSGTSPKAVFQTTTLSHTAAGSYYPGLAAKIRFWSPTLTGSDPNKSIVVADTNNVGYHPYTQGASGHATDVLCPLARPTIGVSSDGAVLFCSFMVPSDFVGGSVDTTSYTNILFTASGNGGASWKRPVKLNPTTPVVDWRYPSISKWNDKVGTDYYCNMVCLKGFIPGSYVNNPNNGESLEQYWSIRVKVPGPTVGINQTSTEVPANYSLAQNFPNPFNPTTNIKFAISKNGFVNLKVYDMSGREVSSLVNEVLAAGKYEYSFNASSLSSGVYFYTLKTEGFTETKKMMLIK
jgi:Secretion system C-terminal sorting domain